MRGFALMAALCLTACGDQVSPAAQEVEQAENPADPQQVEEAQDAADPPQVKQAEKSSEEAKITAELQNSVAKDKADGPSKPVECTVASAPGGVEYKGQCEYFILGGDSFTMVRSDGLPFFESIVEVIIQADTATQANLSVRMSDGEVPSFGTAYREAGESCWINDSLDVCWTEL